MKKMIKPLDYSGDILKSLKKGVLLTTKADGKVNSMTISWGTLGIEWESLIFTVFIRENRFTKEQIEKNPEFVISMPVGAFDKKILSFCGTKSGRSTDKIKELNLTLVEPEVISVPAIQELPLTLECRVVYKQKQDESAVAQESREKFYPQDVSGDFYGANKDYHTAYYGEIVSAYIIE